MLARPWSPARVSPPRSWNLWRTAVVKDVGVVLSATKIQDRVSGMRVKQTKRKEQEGGHRAAKAHRTTKFLPAVEAELWGRIRAALWLSNKVF